VSNQLQLLSLAHRAERRPLFGASQGGANTDAVHVSGVDEISAMGPTILTLPFGSLVVSMVDFGGNANGRAVAIAVDTCGSVLAGLVRQASPDAQAEIDTLVQKLAL
jgi:hypothetical protein